jgi:RNA polymerase sigma-70 factor (ECF subfamily)
MIVQEHNEPNTWDEHSQIELAKRDPQAFAPLYAQYFDPIYRYSYRRLREPELAADATSQIFLKAIAALPRFRSESFRSWLFAIAHNVVIDIVRQTRPRFEMPDGWDMADDQPTPEHQAILNEDRRQLWELLDQLTDEQRAVVELRLAGLTGQEIADQIGRGLAATKSLQWRAFCRLKHLLTLEHSNGRQSTGTPEDQSHAIS